MKFDDTDDLMNTINHGLGQINFHFFVFPIMQIDANKFEVSLGIFVKSI